MSPLSISELIGVATGIGPHASLKQIDEIAALTADECVLPQVVYSTN